MAWESLFGLVRGGDDGVFGFDWEGIFFVFGRLEEDSVEPKLIFCTEMYQKFIIFEWVSNSIDFFKNMVDLVDSFERMNKSLLFSLKYLGRGLGRNHFRFSIFEGFDILEKGFLQIYFLFLEFCEG